MVGWLTWEEGKGRPKLERTRLLGLRLLRLRCSAGRGMRGEERRLRQAVRLLRREGARRVLVPDGFACWELLEEEGLCPVDPAPFCRALAAPLVLALLKRRGVAPERATVLLRGVRVDRALFEAARSLCPMVRTLAVSAPEGGSDLCRLLRQEYGAAVPETAGDRIPDGTADFSPECSAISGALALYSPGLCLAGLELRVHGVQLPDAERLPLLALLWEEGRLPPEKIEIFSISEAQIGLTDPGKVHIIS